MNRYQWLFALDEPTRTRPLDWSAVIAGNAPAQLIAYLNRHSQDRRHHWRDPQWITGVSLEPRLDRELLRVRGRYAFAMPGMEIF